MLFSKGQAINLRVDTHYDYGLSLEKKSKKKVELNSNLLSSVPRKESLVPCEEFSVPVEEKPSVPGQPKGSTKLASDARRLKFEEMKNTIVGGWVGVTKKPTKTLAQWIFLNKKSMDLHLNSYHR